MTFNNISDFLDAIQSRIDELEADDSVTGSTDITASFDLTDDDFAEIDDIIDEAREICNVDSDITKYIFDKLTELGYTDEDILDILDYAGY